MEGTRVRDLVLFGREESVRNVVSQAIFSPIALNPIYSDAIGAEAELSYRY